jgi:hypothetical protein
MARKRTTLTWGEAKTPKPSRLERKVAELAGQAARKVRAAVRGAKKKRKNPVELESIAHLGEAEAEAAQMFERFHGEPPTRAIDLVEEVAYRKVLAKCGKLLELRVLDDADYELCLTPKGVDVYATPDGGQLYFIGGDQAIDIEALGLGHMLPKDHLCLGRCFYIAYHTAKDFHDFQPTDYEHQFGEETGELPALNYDVLNRRIYLTGGAYQVKREGIVN